jgi:uncharacterized protein (TIGR03437 family)
LPRIGPAGPNALFLTKLTPTGAVAFSVLIGAEQNNIATALAVDSRGNIFVGGNTLGQKFPVTVPVDRDPINYSGFVAKISPAGTLLAATWLSYHNTTAYALAVDPSDRLILAGIGDVPGFPRPEFEYQFIARMDTALSRIDRVVYRPGGSPPAIGLAVDAAGNPVIALNAYALAATPGAYDSPRIPTPCRQKMFFSYPVDLSIEKLRADDWSTVYRSVIHAACDAQPRDLQLDRSGAPVVTVVAGPGLPLKRPAWGAPTCWSNTAAVARLTPDGAGLDYATYIPQHCPEGTPPLALPNSASGPSLDGVANAFSGDPTAVVIGGLYSLTVSGVTLPRMGRASLTTPVEPLPRKLGGVEVRFDGTAAEILETAPGRVVVVVPPRDLRARESRSVGIQVFVNGVASNLVGMPLVDSLPGFLTADFLTPAADAGIGIAYALNADFTINSADNPAPAGSTITLFATGLGVPPRPLYASWKVGPSNLPPETVEPLPGFIPAVWQVKMTLPPGGESTGVTQYRIGVRLSVAGFSSTPLASNGVSIFVK